MGLYEDIIMGLYEDIIMGLYEDNYYNGDMWAHNIILINEVKMSYL